MIKKKGTNTHCIDRFQYYVEDCDCRLCAYYKGRKYGCALSICLCDDIGWMLWRTGA